MHVVTFLLQVRAIDTLKSAATVVAEMQVSQAENGGKRSKRTILSPDGAWPHISIGLIITAMIVTAITQAEIVKGDAQLDSTRHANRRLRKNNHELQVPFLCSK